MNTPMATPTHHIYMVRRCRCARTDGPGWRGEVPYGTPLEFLLHLSDAGKGTDMDRQANPSVHDRSRFINALFIPTTKALNNQQSGYDRHPRSCFRQGSDLGGSLLGVLDGGEYSLQHCVTPS